MSELTTYPAYKTSGVPEIGTIPDHWDVKQLGRIGRFFKGNGGPKEDDAATGVPCIRYGDIYMHYQFTAERSWSHIPDTLTLNYTPIAYGDLLFAGSGETIEEIGKSVVNLIVPPVYCGGDVIIFRASIPFDARFLGYAADSRPSVEQKSRVGRGITVMHVYGDQLKYVWMAVPPIAEQTAIASFLDHANRRVRRYVQTRLRLIRLLEEYRSTVIAKSVTRGLESDVPLKNSTVSWLGDIPAGWEIRRNGRLFVERKLTGFADLPILEVSLRTGVRVRGFGEGSRKQIMSDRAKYKRARAGDIAYNMMRMWQGAVGVVPEDGLVSPAYVVAAAQDGVDTRYYSYLFRTNAYKGEVDACSHGIVKDRNRLYWDDFKQIASPYPPHDEQRRIADFIASFEASVDQLISQQRAEVELVTQYRARLIADVVTGKLDVREAAQQLPEEPVDEDELSEPHGILEEGEEADLDLDELVGSQSSEYRP